MTGGHILNAPELLIGRNDSKNPASTCRGITSTGRPCRRALAIKKFDGGNSLIEDDGVVALVEDEAKLQDAAYFCWQHKDQAQSMISHQIDAKFNKPIRRTTVVNLKNRSSIETLMQRLDINSQPASASNVRQKRKQRPVQAFTDCPSKVEQSRPNHAPAKVSSRRRKAEPSFWRSLCCMVAADDDDRIEIIRHRTRVAQGRTSSNVPRKLQPEHRQFDEKKPAARVTQPGHNAATNSALIISPSLSAHVRSNLTAEMNKPISIHDEEGYIYMFWLTPSSKRGPDETIAESLLQPNPRHQQTRRISDVMSEYSTSEQAGEKTILLKIGRASNVTRRMHEWQRQCGYELSLVRWYPYMSSSSRQSPHPSPTRKQSDQPIYPDLSKHNQTPRHEVVEKVPCVKRVERLIHLELAEQQVKQQCSACGKEHREWFEVYANEQGIRAVDQIIRRWVSWSQQNHGHD